MITTTVQMTPDEFRSRIARFAKLKPNVDEYVAVTGVNSEAYRHTAAQDIFYLLGASNPEVAAATAPAIAGPKGTSVYIVGSPPQDGPSLHAHMRTWETFVVLNGMWEFTAGDHEQLKAKLGPCDMFSCPPGVSRRFRNISDEHANLLVIVQGDAEALDDIAIATDIGEDIERRWGADARAGLERIGMSFTVRRTPATEHVEL